MKLTNKLLTIVVLLYLFAITINYIILYSKINDLAPPDYTAKASAKLRFCINQPPRLNYTCPASMYEHNNFYCRVNVTDGDGPYLYFESFFYTPVQAFNVTLNGIINITPEDWQVGNHTFQITVFDGSGCNNGADEQIYHLEIINVNDPPVLMQPIPNQTWDQDTSLTAFDLDEYFMDPDGDQINYTFTFVDHIGITLGNGSLVTFTPEADWFGTAQVIFFAWDPYLANASSNNVILTVRQTKFPPPENPPITPQQGGGGGGGGGNAGNTQFCLPRWYCTPWGPCEPDSFRRRNCNDLNKCNTTFGKPNITEPCNFISSCFDGFKGPEEEGIDCGGPCPTCGNCYDRICNNEEDCIKGLTDIPDCGGPCKPCEYNQETCYDSICNNEEDCTLGLTDIPDCGGPCDACAQLTEKPANVGTINWSLIVMILFALLLTAYLVRRFYPLLILFAKKRKKKYYEEKIMLEAKILESILESLAKLEDLLGKEDIQKLIILFSTIIRKYFKGLFDLRYEFTYEELMSEINARHVSPILKKVLKDFFDRTIELEFSGKSVSREEIYAMVSEFKHILSLTSPEPLLKDDKAFRLKKNADSLEKMFMKIAQAETLLRREHLNEAYFIYITIVHDYSTLPQKDKTKINNFISRLYEEIKLAREKFEYEHQENKVSHVKQKMD